MPSLTPANQSSSSWNSSMMAEPVEMLTIEVGPFKTAAICIQFLGHSQILKDYAVTESLLTVESGKLKVAEDRLAAFLHEIDCSTRKVTLVLNGLNAFTIVQKVPISMEHRLRAYLQETLLKKNKLELSHYFWTATPLNDGRDEKEELAGACASHLSALVCGTRKNFVDTLLAAFKKQGFAVENVLFHLPSMLKGFEFHAGTMLTKHVVALVHLSHDRYSQSIMRNGALVTHREAPLAPSTDKSAIAEEVRSQIAIMDARFKSPVKCVFVSCDGNDPEPFVDLLKSFGCYARSWNAVRKLSHELKDPKRSLLTMVAPELNATWGAALAAYEKEVPPESSMEEEIDDVAAICRMFVRPLAAAACILFPILIYLIMQNILVVKSLNVARRNPAIPQKSATTTKTTLEQVNRRIQELESFHRTRPMWSPILAELTKTDVPKVEVVQLKASETILIAEPNPFGETRDTRQRRRNAGAFVVEARNTGGLTALEQFMTCVQTNTAIAPVLNKRQPLRLLNNFEAAENTSQSLFTLEYALEEKNF